jgi:hypothetical protein
MESFKLFYGTSYYPLEEMVNTWIKEEQPIITRYQAVAAADSTSNPHASAREVKLFITIFYQQPLDSPIAK